MSAYLPLALPLYIAGQIALMFDLDARVLAFLGGRWPLPLLVAVFFALASALLWAPWLALAVGLAPASALSPWIWAQGVLGGALFAVYAAAPLPGIKKRPAEVQNQNLRVEVFPRNSDPVRPHDPLPLEVRRDRVKVPPARSLRQNLRIGVISDLHVYSPDDLPFVHWCVDRLNEFSPDLLVALGDLTRVEGMAGPTAAALARAEPRLGVCVCLGNHDLALRREKGDEFLAQRYPRIVRSRDGEREVCPGLTVSATEWPFDRTAGELAGRGKAAGLDPARYRLLLAHSPDNIGRAARAGYDLLLCGHTHGGFPYLPGFGPVTVPIRWGRGLAEGWFRKRETLVFVTRGVGYVLSSPSARRPQVACIDLVVSENSEGARNIEPIPERPT